MQPRSSSATATRRAARAGARPGTRRRPGIGDRMSGGYRTTPGNAPAPVLASGRARDPTGRSSAATSPTPPGALRRRTCATAAWPASSAPPGCPTSRRSRPTPLPTRPGSGAPRRTTSPCRGSAGRRRSWMLSRGPEWSALVGRRRVQLRGRGDRPAGERGPGRRRRSPGRARTARSGGGPTASSATRSIGRPRCSPRRACGPGDRVGILLPLLPETVIAVLALGRLRAIYTPIFSGYAAGGVAAA